tara:strand:- start:1844 stop:2641 length:798 start_codon:yes stop_codon:yes gene_type:complete
MKKINLNDGTPIYCLKETEAIVLDEHIKGYLNLGINIKEDDTIIDVGANIGVLGVRLSKKFKSINIYAFEPILAIHNILAKNAEISLNKNFKTFKLGISNKNGKMNFIYYPNSPALSTSKPEIWEKDNESFLAAVEGNITNVPVKFWWAKLIPKFLIPWIAKYLKSNQQQVQSRVITLSNFIESEKIKKIDLLKIDCEGEELNVLKGVKKNHWTIIKSIVMEVYDVNNNFELSKSILSMNGFKNIKSEKERGFEKTRLINIFATK